MLNPAQENWTMQEKLCGERITMGATLSASGQRYFKGLSGQIYNEKGKPISRDEAPEAYRTLEPNSRPATTAEIVMAAAKFNAMFECRAYA